MHFSVAVMLCDMTSQLTSNSLNSKGQGQGYLVTFAKDRFIRIFWMTSSLKQLGLLALLIIILALLPYVYKRSCPKQISHCSLSAQGSDPDLMVLLFSLYRLAHANLFSTVQCTHRLMSMVKLGGAIAIRVLYQ